MTAVATRGTTNGNDRGNSYARRRRRQWLIENYASNVPGFCRCYRCGVLLFNPDDRDSDVVKVIIVAKLGSQDQDALPLTVDRIIPGAHGGTYRRNNIRPCCGPCNSETGGSTRAKK